ASFFKRIGNTLARAFSSDSAFIYALGLIVFFVIPYAVLFVPLTIKGNKTEFVFFILRLLLVFVFTLMGWVVTLTALVKLAGEPKTTPDPTSKAKAMALPKEQAA